MKTTRNNENPRLGANLGRSLRVVGLLTVAVLLVGLFAIGCGSGGKGGSGRPAQSRMTLTFTWPDITSEGAESRRIPRRARSLRLTVKQGETVIRNVIRNRPASQAATEETITIENLPFVPGLTIHADALDGADASGTVLALADATIMQSGDAFQPIPMTLDSVVDTLEVTGASFKDANGNGTLDTEDRDHNGTLDAGEDKNSNGKLDTEYLSDIRVGDTTLITVTPKHGNQVVLIDPQELEVAGSGANFDVQKSPNSLTLTVIGKKRNGAAGTVTVTHDRDNKAQDTQADARASFTVLVRTRVTLENVDFFSIDQTRSQITTIPGAPVRFTLRTDSGEGNPPAYFNVPLFLVNGSQLTLQPVNTPILNGSVLEYRAGASEAPVIAKSRLAIKDEAGNYAEDSTAGDFTLTVKVSGIAGPIVLRSPDNSTTPLDGTLAQGKQVRFRSYIQKDGVTNPEQLFPRSLTDDLAPVNENGAARRIVLKKRNGKNPDAIKDWDDVTTITGRSSTDTDKNNPLHRLIDPTGNDNLGELRVPMGESANDDYCIVLKNETGVTPLHKFTVLPVGRGSLSPDALAGRRTTLTLTGAGTGLANYARSDNGVLAPTWDRPSIGTLAAAESDPNNPLKQDFLRPGTVASSGSTATRISWTITGIAEYDPNFKATFSGDKTYTFTLGGDISGTVK